MYGAQAEQRPTVDVAGQEDTPGRRAVGDSLATSYNTPTTWPEYEPLVGVLEAFPKAVTLR